MRIGRLRRRLRDFPVPLMQKLGENISVRKYDKRLLSEVKKVFASAKMPQELAARLGLKPIRLKEELRKYR